ncbi:MAG TPA: aminotransferase class IV, partial [Gammaproteobacteria bacterium]|nr:aminotransferase class IV [Gammaproteobacteria bacterium]
RDGMVTEGAVSNIFIVSHGVMLTPPKSPLLLPGITRDLIIELAQSNAMVCKEQEISEHALRGADEIWITSSTREILPVVTLDGKVIADGKPGAVWHRMIDIYQEYKKRLRSGEVS